MKIIKSIEEFRKLYFPKEYAKRKLAEMSPIELGRYLANNLIIDIKNNCHNQPPHPTTTVAGRFSVGV